MTCLPVLYFIVTCDLDFYAGHLAIYAFTVSTLEFKLK